jgi:hypothetical protein
LSRCLYSQCLGKPPDLPRHNPKAYDNQAAHSGSRAGADKRVSKAELVDRNAKSDHPETRKKGKEPDTIQ